MKAEEIKLGGRRIGRGHPCFVIAEAGVNHNGDLALAERLVDLAADAGADAVKFQSFNPEALAAPEAAKARYQVETTGGEGTQLEMLRALALPPAAHERLIARARARGILFLSTPFDAGSADLLERLGLPAFKVSSGDLTNLPLLAHLARKGRPILVSTGMGTMDEVGRALATIATNGDPRVALFHCVSNYPTDPADCNLRAIDALRAAFDVPTGWSDHTDGIDISLAAVARGAELLEKHFTVDRTLPGPDHRASLEPGELQALVAGARRIEAALGDGVKRPRPSEAAVAAVARRSLHYRRSLAAGEAIGAGDLVALRPGTGIPTEDEPRIVGQRVVRDVAARQAVAWEDLDGDDSAGA